MTYAELKTELRTRIGVPTDDSLFTTTVLGQLVNAALQHIAVDRDWPWLEQEATITTANGDDSYAVPANWMRTLHVVGAGGVPLERTAIERLDYMNGSGSPRFYGVFSDEVVVRPTPTAIENLKHRYIGTEPALSADGDTPLMPTGYHYAIVAFAAYLAYRRTGNMPEAGAAMAEYETWRERMARQLDRFSDSEGGAANAETVEVKQTVRR